MINADKPQRWRADVEASVHLYNTWFLNAAPDAYRGTRLKTIENVATAFSHTGQMLDITAETLARHPEILPTLRMCTAPPIARDRLTGLSYVPKTFVDKIDKTGALPPRTSHPNALVFLSRMCGTIVDLLDVDLMAWVPEGRGPAGSELELATTVVADRLCGSFADPIIRNAQEQRQLALIKSWLEARGYKMQAHPARTPLTDMAPGTFSFRMNVVVGTERKVNIPVDAVIQPHQPRPHRLPLLIEAKSAGDFTNTNKRRKEEAQKARQLLETYGSDIELLLFLCGYFDAGYLGYEAAEGIDWVWEHRIDDLEQAGV